MRKPAAFLDRDGIINVDFGHVGQICRLQYIPNALECIARLNRLGFLVFVVTNQAGIAKGKYSIREFDSIMNKISQDLKKFNGHLDDIRFCPYHENAIIEQFRYYDHPWRKPNPGMILDLIQTWDVDIQNSFLVGDNVTDLLAAKAANVAGFLYSGQVDLETFVFSIPQVERQKAKLKIAHK